MIIDDQDKSQIVELKAFVNGVERPISFEDYVLSIVLEDGKHYLVLEG